jgi:hypothetical protein
MEEEEVGHVWLSCLSVVLSSCVYFYPAFLSNSALSLQAMRTIWFYARFYAALFVLFNKEYAEITPWVVDICFPLLRINLSLVNQLITVSMPEYMEIWNLLLIAEFLAINFLICPTALSFAGNTVFSTLQSADLQLTICWVFSKWTVPESFWGCVIPLSLAVQWLLVCGFLPLVSWRDYAEWTETTNLLVGQFWKEGNSGQMWFAPIMQLSLWILWLQMCSMWFGASLAVQLLLTAAGVWGLVLVHSELWPHQERVVNLLVEDMLTGLWLALLFWVPLQHPLILVAIILFSVRKLVYH